MGCGCMMELTDNTFRNFVSVNGLVLVDFSAKWCQPCKVMSKYLRILEKDYNYVAFASVDVDACPNITRQYRINSVPILMIFKKGDKVGEIEGVGTLEELKGDIDKILKGI